MNDETIRTYFIESGKETIGTYLQETITIESIEKHTGTRDSKGVAAVIGLVDGIAGHCIVDISVDVMLHIASKMMGESVTAVSEMTKAAIAELTNVICGKAVTDISNAGLSCDITPPNILMGEAMNLSSQGLESTLIEYRFGKDSNHAIFVDVAFTLT